MTDQFRIMGRQNGKTRASAAVQALAETLADAFERNPKSGIDRPARVAMAEVENEDGTVAVRILTFGEIAAAVVEAGWTPPRP